MGNTQQFWNLPLVSSIVLKAHRKCLAHVVRLVQCKIMSLCYLSLSFMFKTYDSVHFDQAFPNSLRSRSPPMLDLSQFQTVERFLLQPFLAQFRCLELFILPGTYFTLSFPSRWEVIAPAACYYKHFKGSADGESFQYALSYVGFKICEDIKETLGWLCYILSAWSQFQHKL